MISLFHYALLGQSQSLSRSCLTSDLCGTEGTKNDTKNLGVTLRLPIGVSKVRTRTRVLTCGLSFIGI